MAVVCIPSQIQLMVSSTSTLSLRLTIAIGSSPFLISLTSKPSGLALLSFPQSGMQSVTNSWMRILPLKQALPSMVLRKHQPFSPKTSLLSEIWRSFHSSRVTRFPLTSMLSVLAPTASTNWMPPVYLLWESTLENQSSVIATSKRCLRLLKLESSSTRSSSVLSTHSTNTTRSLYQNTTLAPWRTLASSHTTKITYSVGRYPLSLNVFALRAPICTSSPTCGLETSSQWNGGMTSG